MELEMKPFQIDAEARLLDALEGSRRDIVFKSCTGSGKTIVLTDMMETFCSTHEDAVFIWFTPGSGDLAGQSKAKMDKYIPGAQTKLLRDVLDVGFDSGDKCFVNWEKLHGRNNVAMADGERQNFLDRLEEASGYGLHFYVVVDESHTNDTVRTREIIDYVAPEKIIRSSATPTDYSDAVLIEVDEDDVIEQELIKKGIVLNEGVDVDADIFDEVEYLIDLGIQKRDELARHFAQAESKVNPLILVQLADNDDEQRRKAEQYLEENGITYDNGLLASWLSDDHRNTDNIEDPSAPQRAVIIKQAVATGWDCPRAHVLVKLRENMGEVFQIQTIGRIRRMPEAKHYGDNVLDHCYIYTLDTRFIDEAKRHESGHVWQTETLRLKEEYAFISLMSEQRSVGFEDNLDYRQFSGVLKKHFIDELELTNDCSSNKTLFKRAGYRFDDRLGDTTHAGTVEHVDAEEIRRLATIGLRVKRPSKALHDEYSRRMWKMSQRMRLNLRQFGTVMRNLFLTTEKHPGELLNMYHSEYYYFVLNNWTLLAEAVESSLANVAVTRQLLPGERRGGIVEKQFYLPTLTLFTYDPDARNQRVMETNVYLGYRASAERRFKSERKFERFCESADSRVRWVYKNGDKGSIYFSIMFADNSGRSRAFYPDYVVGTDDGETWIIEAKGGRSSSGEDENIDKFAAMKFNALKEYLERHQDLHGGFVRYDEQSDLLLICVDGYTDDLDAESWAPIDQVL